MERNGSTIRMLSCQKKNQLVVVLAPECIAEVQGLVLFPLSHENNYRIVILSIPSGKERLFFCFDI